MTAITPSSETAMPTHRPGRNVDLVAILRRLLPVIIFLLMLGFVISLNPRVASYNGMTLMLGLAVPILWPP